VTPLRGDLPSGTGAPTGFRTGLDPRTRPPRDDSPAGAVTNFRSVRNPRTQRLRDDLPSAAASTKSRAEPNPGTRPPTGTASPLDGGPAR
jgi:hypothetical protein